ncbi:PREDICTED: cyclin N-terminal domain-containing protein 1-like [Acropora digitifera]|uniref:cyclin N-terminal domain-containing protein 1-like n=1 Tax=Acropora digitifera TaxID=70779 RepID=UPI00077A47E8|nr:PREDICTED: cyclin N-terminal domain-containing protein 1-like [Acropora digitifera]XP_029194295.1 cyclin N-terminal domain-containing protein 1-like [Acropora millepora]
MYKSRIFGTPPEPVFNMKSACMPPELLEESLYVLADINEKNMDDASRIQGFFKGGKTAAYVFLLCEDMGLPSQTRFLAIEIFDRFMSKHVCGLYELIRSNSETNQQKNWKEVENRVKTQLPLRVMSCVQLASKLTSHYKVVTASKGQRFLNSIGHCYSLGSIVKSELRILTELDYHILVTTPLTFLETVLEILGHNDSRSQVKLLHEASVKLLDIVYLKFEEIYSKLCMAATGENCISDRQKLSVLANDLMLLAVSIIGAASYIVNQATSDMVVEQLGRITQIPVDDILDFATIIIEHTL